MKKLGLATAVLLAMTGAHAYQFEVQGQSEYVDTTANDKNFTGTAQGTYYLKNVDASKGPLAEAAFLNQASNVSVAYNYIKYDEKDTVNVESHTYGIKGEAYVPTPYVPVYASASYNHTINDFKDGVSDDNGDRYALEAGAMLLPNFLVAVGYTSVADQISLDAFGVNKYGIAKAVGESVAIDEKQDAVTARTKYVGNIDGTNMAIGFEAFALFAEDNAYGMKTDLFLTPKLSVGASFADVSAFNSGYDHVWGGHTQYFITPAIAVGADFVKANAKDGNPRDTQTIGLNAKFRF
ncbi:porin Omp33-36 [Acinetobacter seifertii]|uniref:Porin Omp33-36 n=2 Tax=Acinetobacter TaxID=469 RepID=A0A7H2TL39_9GAMM|nr:MULTISPECIES: porin Omp33-36 [Acinetobacter]KHO15859.1 membrane protein [Acinetobacter baumannii]MBJ9422587.1 porin Omp33-36 [Acinetobacter seifertii]MCH2002168.1 porin Omp33-36 [Acinetobacter seifertii]MDB0280889.1 carbapenem susceptibility porin CarO [Acinetobacter seifertii]MDK4792242.1 porin Omp33-36 [Acinetobacter sp.]